MAHYNSGIVKKELPEKKGLELIVVKDEKTLLNVIKEVLPFHRLACFVIANNIYSNLSLSFKENDLPISKFYFIDMLSGSQTPVYANRESVSPKIDNIADSIRKVIQHKNCDLLIIDNLNSMLSYNSKHSVEKMINEMAGEINVKKLFFCQRNELLKDEEENFMKDIFMFADSTKDLSQ